MIFKISVFQPIKKYFKTYTAHKFSTRYLVVFTDIEEWKSKGLNDESIKCLTASNDDKILSPELSYSGSKASLEINGSFLIQYKDTFNHGKIVNI